jgi:murein L,D-transpeptidase YafK
MSLRKFFGMLFRTFLLPLVLAAVVVGPHARAHEPEPQRADRVLVDKSDRLLYLMHGGEVWRTYPIGLGFAPEGPKQREGDGRTPEGNYLLDWRNPRSSYYLSIHISYPDPYDEARAQARGVLPGGGIFIHGEHDPNRPNRDWTLGCIAVTNRAMQEIWLAVPDGTPITIQP